MSAFRAYQGAHTPATNQDNYTFEADTAGDVAQVTEISWGGRLTTSTGYRTRWVRPSTAGSSTFTAVGAIQGAGPNIGATALCRFGTFATAPTLPADPTALHAQDWNAHGGIGYIVLPLGSPWFVINGVSQAQISCRNVAGTDANGSSYGLGWSE
jgi:hypothetical protein